MGHDSGSILETDSPAPEPISTHPHPAPVQPRPSYPQAVRPVPRGVPQKERLTPPASSRFTCRNILLVGCDDGLRSLLRAYLEHVGFRVIACADLEAAIRVLAEGRSTQLLLIDSKMLATSSPRLRESLAERNPDLPVFVISGKRMTDGTLSQLSYRVWEPDSQPFQFPDLLGRIQASLESATLADSEA